MSVALYGMGVSRGIAIGNVHVIQKDQHDIREYKLKENEIDTEVKRLESAITCAREQLRSIRKHIPRATDTDIAAFIDTHLLMLEDSALTHEPARLIREFKYNAEWALKQQRDALVSVFEEMNDPYLRTRKDDVDYVVNRIQRFLTDRSPMPHEETDSRKQLSGYIVLANDLTPADTVLMQHNGITGFLTEYGGPTSHTAILARSLGIPAIVGVQQALKYVNEDDYVILDGTHGVLIVDPDKRTLYQYEKLQRKEKRYYSDLKKLKGKPAITLDKTVIDLQANIELPADFDTVKEVGANGVGLYRTEFLYMNRDEPPDEEEHYDTYTKVIDVLDGLPLTIRTLDLGADKQVDGGRQSGPIAANPALGLRAVRLCLKEPSLFRPQIRAILRASVHGPVRVMIPMLSNLHEMNQVLQIVEETKSELAEKGIPFDHEIQLGGMIEVPAAAVCADMFARHLDFLSIGTNDLIQYTMAIDRVNDEVNYLYDPLHPAVLKLIHGTIKAGEKAGIPVALCGEMAGESQYTRLLLGLGLREFSVHPSVLLEIKQIITQSHIEELSRLAKKALSAENGIEVAEILSTLQPTRAS
ncbi:MAG TPA: phosphoenolpyruvate--protein phosphotransferase [Gammaproteobacteria bacterium]